jgi:hypothetical protein
MAKTIKEAKSNNKTIMVGGLGLNNNMPAIRGIGTKKKIPTHDWGAWLRLN